MRGVFVLQDGLKLVTREVSQELYAQVSTYISEQADRVTNSVSHGPRLVFEQHPTSGVYSGSLPRSPQV